MATNNNIIIFDCDGTLVDTFTLIEKTVYLTFEKMLPEYPLTLEEAHRFFGPFLNDSFKKYAKTEEEVEQLVECYRKINEALMEQYIYAYDGIEELLKTLKQNNYQLAVVSNKVTDDVVKSLKLCHIDTYFDLIVGAEKLKEAKPNPDGIYQVLHFFNKQQAYMIGDTVIDIKTGQNANINVKENVGVKVKTIGVTWCQTKKETFIETGADFIVDHPSQIWRIIEENIHD